MNNFVCFLFAIIGVAQGLPGKYGMYYPKRSMMFGSYYSNPMETGYEYVPQGQMTAMVSGDTVATNSFSGGQPWKAPSVVVPNISTEEISDVHPSAEHITEKQQPSFSENEADAEFDVEADNKSQEADSDSSSEAAEIIPITEAQVIVSSTKAPKVQHSKKVSPKRKAKKPVKQEEAEDEDEEEDMAPVWPFGALNSRKASGFPGYNTFFPIFIGGTGSSRSRTRSSSLEDAQEAAALPSGSATAIANSFSTGKGGVATSHATSFGDPMAAAFLRNAGLFGDYEAFAKRTRKPASENRD